MGDTCRQVSWLTARALCSDLPNGPNAGPSVALRSKLAAYSCGSSRGFRPENEPYRVPFSHRHASADEPTRASMDQIDGDAVKRVAASSGDPPAIDLLDAACTRIEPTRRQLDVRGAVDARNAKEIVAAERLPFVCSRPRARGDANDVYLPVRPCEIEMVVAMVVPVQDKLGAVFCEHALKLGRIAQSPSRRRLSGQRRMMDQHDADQALAPAGCKNLGKCCNLAGPKLAGGDERRRRHRRVQSDKRGRAEAAQEGKPRAPGTILCAQCVAAHVVGPT